MEWKDLRDQIKELKQQRVTDLQLIERRDEQLQCARNTILTYEQTITAKNEVIADSRRRIDELVKTLHKQTSANNTSFNSGRLLTIEASCKHVLNLPLQVLAMIFTDYMSLKDVAFFDIACTNHESRLRSAFLGVIADPLVEFKETHIKKLGKVLDWMALRRLNIASLSMSYGARRCDKHEHFPLGLRELSLERPTQMLTRLAIDSFPLTLTTFKVINASIRRDDFKKLLSSCKLLSELSIEMSIRPRASNTTSDYQFVVSFGKLLETSASLRTLTIGNFKLRDYIKCSSNDLEDHSLPFSTWQFIYKRSRPAACLVENLTLDGINNGCDSDLEKFIQELFPKLQFLTLTGSIRNGGSKISDECIERLRDKGIIVESNIVLLHNPYAAYNMGHTAPIVYDDFGDY